MRFEFATATRIVFGPGTLNEVGKLAAEVGRRALVVTGRTPARAAPLLERLAAQELETATVIHSEQRIALFPLCCRFSVVAE